MSGTLQSATPSTAVYQQWKVDVYQALGEKIEQRNVNPTAPKLGPSRPLPKVEFTGKAASTSWVGRMLAERVLGSPDERHHNRPEDADTAEDCQQTIDRMKSEGTAAPVEIVGEGGRKLRGNFFSRTGHNLKEKDGQVDTSRPVVLLLTGSGGTAELQGLPMAEFYATEGASVLSVNYAGYGDSEEPAGTPSELSLKQDAQSMLQYLVDLGYDPGKIIIHGFSLGGAIAAELQAANEKQGTEFRGVVLDRPMLSTVHGVEGHKGKAAHPVAAIAREMVGAFQGERAVKELNSDTPLVITSDKGRFAERADLLRQQLQAKGEASGAPHMESGRMLTANEKDLRVLVEHDRTGADDDRRVRTAELPSEVLYEDMLTICNKTVANMKQTITDVTNELNPLAEVLEQNQKVDQATKFRAWHQAETLLNKVRAQMGELLDLTTSGLLGTSSPKLTGIGQAAKKANLDLEQLCVRLHGMLPGQGVDPFPCSQEEIDFAGLRAAEALQRLLDAPNGASLLNLEEEVLKAQGLRFSLGITNGKVGRMHGDMRKVFEHLQRKADEIRNRRLEASRAQ